MVFTHYNRFLRKMLGFLVSFEKTRLVQFEQLWFSSHYVWAGLSPFKSQHPFHTSLRLPRTFGFDYVMKTLFWALKLSSFFYRFSKPIKGSKLYFWKHICLVSKPILIIENRVHNFQVIKSWRFRTSFAILRETVVFR